MKITRILAGVAVAGVILIPAAPAFASPEGAHHVKSSCVGVSAFYGNPDEPLGVGDVKRVESTVNGIKLNGPSSLHRELDPHLTLANLPATATLTQTVSAGSGALVKVETINPDGTGYTNIVYGPDGVWSSRIPADQPGGQSHPVATPADLIGKSDRYTAETVGFTVGFGYGNDTGNATTVHTLAFAGKTYRLRCLPPATGTAGPTHTASPKPPRATHSPVTVSPVPVLPQTPGASSSKLAILGGIAGFLVLGGGGLFYLARERRVTTRG